MAVRDRVVPADDATVLHGGDDQAFLRALVSLMRAHDSYGVWDSKPDEMVLARFILSPEKRRAIPVTADPDAAVLWRLEVFYTAVGLAVSRRTGLDVTSLVKVSGEGFGRAVITVGILVLASRPLRDVHRFGFESIGALASAGEDLVSTALARIYRFPALACETG